MNFIPCLAWVPKGAAKTEPIKLKLEPEELKELIQQTKEDYREICGKDDLSENELEQAESSRNECNKKSQSEKNSHDDKKPSKKIKMDKNEDDDDEDFNKRYNLDDYDEDDTDNPIFTINDIAMYADNKDDNYITSKDVENEDELEEEEDFKLKTSDNLLIAGRVEDDRSLLEIYVYNHEEDSFYVHHDIVLPAFPLALEWLDYHAEDEKGNYLAVGDMTPIIKVWDLDVVDVLEPDYKLGKTKPVKKNSLKKGHTDAVLSLNWNKCLRDQLASGSADSTICIWNLQQKIVAHKLHDEDSSEDNKIQALHWNPNKSSLLLSGSTNGSVNLYDITDANSPIKTWTFEGEVEKVTWHLKEEYKFFCAVTLNNGSSELSCIDLRNDHKYTRFGHALAITGLDFSPHSNILMTTGMDKQMKFWKLSNTNEIELIKSQKLKIGSLYSSKVNPDLPFIVAVGGDNKQDNLKVIDVMKNGSTCFENTLEEES